MVFSILALVVGFATLSTSRFVPSTYSSSSASDPCVCIATRIVYESRLSVTCHSRSTKALSSVGLSRK